MRYVDLLGFTAHQTLLGRHNAAPSSQRSPNASGEILFSATPTGADPQTFINAIRITAIPEPSTAVRLMLGLVALAGDGRRGKA